MKNKGLITAIGFILFLYGMLALVLSLVGLKLSFLLLLDQPGPVFGFTAKVLMVIIGLILVYIARTDFSGEGPVN